MSGAMPLTISGRLISVKKLISFLSILIVLVMLVLLSNTVYKDYKEKSDSDAQMYLKPQIVQEANTSLLMDFAPLKAVNEDIVTWLYIEGLGIDYPLVQGIDNSYYLEYTAAHKYNKLGALFLDYRNSPDFTDFNSIVYGHNMASGQMFGRLRDMKERECFDRVTSGTLYTPATTYSLDIFALVIADAASGFYRYAFPDTASKEEQLTMIRDYALYYRDIGVSANDRLISLSTCSSEYEESRAIVIARISERK